MAGTPGLPSVIPTLPGVPNIQAVVDKTADYYFSQGVLGSTIILLLLLLLASWSIIWILYKALRKQDDKIQSLLRDALTYISGARDAEIATKEALKGVEDTLAIRPQLLADISHQLELLANDTRHGFNNISQMGRGFVSAIRDLRETLGLVKKREAE